jgi:hypothetical protein
LTREELQVRAELSALAADTRGRHLLQLALRGIQESGRGLTFGCWVKPDGGVSGCLFQHAYWQGLQEGVFRPVELDPKGELREYVGDEEFTLVMGAIRAFDSLGKRRFVRWQRGRHGIPVRKLDAQRWRSTVERILVDVLAERLDEAGDRAEPMPPRLPVGARHASPDLGART